MYLPENASVAQRQAAVDEYSLNLKRLMMRERMPLLKVIAHQYYQKDTPVWIYLQSQAPKRRGNRIWRKSAAIRISTRALS